MMHDPDMVRNVRADIANVVSLLTDLRLVRPTTRTPSFPTK